MFMSALWISPAPRVRTYILYQYHKIGSIKKLSKNDHKCVMNPIYHSKLLSNQSWQLRTLLELLRASPRERLLLLPPRMGLPKLRLQEGQRSTGTTDSYYPDSECENCCEGFARSHFGSPSCTKINNALSSPPPASWIIWTFLEADW